jgi:rifampin ADP-ribosylating transferase
MARVDPSDFEALYHGTKADLKAGDLIAPGFQSNFGKRKTALFVYLSATLNAAAWGAELAIGEGVGRIYIVAPTGPIEDDPNLTDKRFPGNPTQSFRSKAPLLIIGEVSDWQGHSEAELGAMRVSLERLKQLGVEAIED